MILRHGLQLAYCTNIHPGETWEQTFHALKTRVLNVKRRVCPQAPFAIGLRLSHRAACSLAQPRRLLAFQRWLARHDCYIFTLNGFPYGQFHGTRVKEQVYAPDWTTSERLEYTNRLFDLLARLLPPGMTGSVSTVPGSFKEFITAAPQETKIRRNLWRCARHIARVSKATGRTLHLGLEPEPLGWLENTAETVAFFRRMQAAHPGDPRLHEFIGVNYDTCHFALQFEDPSVALTTLRQAGIKISKIHLSSALEVAPTRQSLAKLAAFADDVYLHQVIVRDDAGRLTRFRDLPDALSQARRAHPFTRGSRWRIHFHVPLHAPARPPFKNTNPHLLGTLDWLAANPGLCSHLEMETYTWAVLPRCWRTAAVEDQLAGEYAWTLSQLARRGLAGRPSAAPTTARRS